MADWGISRLMTTDHYTPIKTQSHKLERVNILSSDILKIELEEITLSNSGQQSLTN